MAVGKSGTAGMTAGGEVVILLFDFSTRAVGHPASVDSRGVVCVNWKGESAIALSFPITAEKVSCCNAGRLNSDGDCSASAALSRLSGLLALSSVLVVLF